MRNIFFFLLLVSVFSFSACDQAACESTNPIFSQYEPDSEEYKAELAVQLQQIDPSSLHFWFEKYVETEGQELMYFSVQGADLCAKMALSAQDWKKLSKVAALKGKSYRGAEFVDLRYEIVQGPNKTSFIFEDFASIIN